ncbi:hypothetical protein OG594_37850 [Streptomyces sp. NBC_01214]|uniref:hypothetical protein n=1 Tax=Streptomyces sp. NBC_01214 TaxID=2903777 RepID=UPI002254BF25|nr:hypothetical protein [Streptomyces sp. NBC_01214]MCX4807315.1 hypothetical protein [Streptomyces sp. NBC_01214]
MAEHGYRDGTAVAGAGLALLAALGPTYAVAAPPECRYRPCHRTGHGRSLVHRGDWEGFHSTFKVSPDRNTAVAVVCNVDSPDTFRAADQLLDIWST